ncbi:two-component system, NtrC family, sensor histidine kinase GlrK [Mariprofundus micogutta]|uniref:histidine kinase n=1 Tax=Mariprofundus micogutta TaxID=1921010 RepID=A0A1L8CNX6_9PROT|nr:HAMP domain-containing sensor histidine kinase [Mariprofundus micogutta]GAV20621.1 two-component system, NtrC family, sensor histidine kinase GlrK [Mariprofundus micogutta]
MIFKGLSGRIALWFLAVFVFVAFVGWHQLRDITSIHNKATELEMVNHQSHRLHELETGIRKLIDIVRNYLITGSAYHIRDFRDADNRVQRIIDHARANGIEVSKVESTLKDVSMLASKIFALPFSTGNMEGPILMQEIDEKLGELSQSLSSRHHEMDESVNQSMSMVSGLHVDMRYDIMVSLILLFGLLLGLSVYLYLRMIHPIILLRREVGRIENGDFSPVSPDLGDNELGTLSLALNSMGQTLLHRNDELVQAKSLAAHQEKMHALGLMTASIAHEVGNPLTATAALLDLARHKLSRGEHDAADKPLNEAVQELRRTEMMINNILDYGRISSQESEPVNLDAVIESAVQLVRLSSKPNGIRLISHKDSNLPSACGNIDMLRQVMVNLLLNAVDACQANGEICIESHSDDQYVYADVVDQGEGVPESMAEEIFSPLFSTKPKGEGTGLGLSISRDLMRKMSGELELIAGDAKECRFRLSIPLMSED